MDDKNEDQFDNLDNMEFEDYPEDNKEINNEDTPSFDFNEPSEKAYEGFEEYKEDDNSQAYSPIPPIGPGEEANKNADNAGGIPVAPVHHSNERIKRRAKEARLRREKLREKQEKRKKNIVLTIVVFGLLLVLIWLMYFALTDMMPEHLMKQGQKYLVEKEYQKALKMFKMAGDAKPYDPEPVYYQAVALSNLPPTYENQKALYDISQLDNCDKASNYADNVLIAMRKEVERKVGPNYVDNVLYDDLLFRWNINKPIRYYVNDNTNMPTDYLNAVKKAFQEWSTASNGEIMFEEIQGSKYADIVINLLDNIMIKRIEDPDRSGTVNPIIKNNVLEQVDINLKTNYANGRKYELDKFQKLAQHEIGHALGIWGHSSEPTDIMYYKNDYINDIRGRNNLSERDVNTLLLLYKMVPDVIDTPINPAEYNNLFYHYLITAIPGENFELEIHRLIEKLKYDRRNIIIWVDLAINYGYKKQYERSNLILHRVLPLTKNDIQNQHVVLYNLAANYYKMKDYKNAEKFLKLAIMFHEDIYTQMLEAFIDLKLNRRELAKGKLIALNKMYPDNIEIALKLAEVYYFDKERLKAKEVIENLTKVNPSSLRDRRVTKYRIYNAKFIDKNETKKK